MHIFPARFRGERVENLFPKAVVAVNSDAVKKSGWFASRVESEFETASGLNPRHFNRTAVAPRDQFFLAVGNRDPHFGACRIGRLPTDRCFRAFSERNPVGSRCDPPSDLPRQLSLTHASIAA